MGLPVRNTSHPVLIVGAGPTGLVLAIELARRDIPFRLVDRLAEPGGLSRAIFIKSRTLEIFASLGLRSKFYEHGQIVDGVDIYANHMRVAGYRFANLDTPFPHILSLPESDVIEILTAKLESLGGEIERGTEFIGLDPHENRVRAHLRSARAGTYTFDANWVVGTDGYHSAVRQAVDDAFDGKDYPELWGVFDTRLSGWDKPRNIVCAQLEVPIAIPFPLGEDRWRIYFRTMDDKPQPLSEVAARLSVICPEVRLREPEEAAYFHSHARLARAFRVERVFLAGDAAHASNPIEGHGMNAGIQDAYNLGWKLAAMATGATGGVLVESYESERRRVDADIVRSGDEAYGRMGPEARDERAGVYAFLSTPEGQAFAALAESEIDFDYAGSPIVDDIGGEETMTGMTPVGVRIADVDGLVRHGRPVSLHELLSGTALVVLLLAGDRYEDAFRTAHTTYEAATRNCPLDVELYVVLRHEHENAIPTDNLLFDPSGQLHARLAGDEPALVVIRPDGHLGFRSRPPTSDALKTYFMRLFHSN